VVAEGRERSSVWREKKKLVYAIAEDGERGSRWHLKNFKF
jgi:hypothetical protein